MKALKCMALMASGGMIVLACQCYQRYKQPLMDEFANLCKQNM